MIFLKKKWFILTCLLVCLALFSAACSSIPWAVAQSEPTQVPVVTERGVVIAEGRLAPLRSSTISFSSGGELGELLVSEGDVVAQGDVLARLGKRESLEAALSQANLELLVAQQDLDDLQETAELSREHCMQTLVEAQIALLEAQRTLDDLDTEDFQEQLDDHIIGVQEAKDELDDASEELEKYQDLDPDHATRKNAQTNYDEALDAYNDAVYDRDSLQNQLNRARAAVSLASARLEDAQREYDKWKDGPDPDTLTLAEARVSFAAAQVAAAQRALDNTELTAPYSGMIVDLYDLHPGESVTPGLPVVTLADFSAWIVETRDLTELDVVNVEPGQEVEVIPDALPDLKMAGTVESIAQVFTERSGDILYTVRIRLDESDSRLRWGMTVSAVFEP